MAKTTKLSIEKKAAELSRLLDSVSQVLKGFSADLDAFAKQQSAAILVSLPPPPPPPAAKTKTPQVPAEPTTPLADTIVDRVSAAVIPGPRARSKVIDIVTRLVSEDAAVVDEVTETERAYLADKINTCEGLTGVKDALSTLLEITLSKEKD